jgi:5-methylcytosine-specific restriction endonuclease McrA
VTEIVSAYEIGSRHRSCDQEVAVMYTGTQRRTRGEALADVEERFRCSHDETGIRARTIAGGSVQFVHQCQRCGEPVGTAIAKASVKGTPPPFDRQRQEAWSERRKREREAVETRYANAFWQDYAEYLASDLWGERRRRVMERAAGLCEGCRSTAPAVVHHLTYEHLGNELLFELVALCAACHGRCHPDRKDLQVADD